MFKQLLSGNYVEHMQKMAIPLIKESRLKNKDIFDCIINFVSKNNLLISNIKLLIGKQSYWEFVEIYSIDADTIAKQLTKLLCETFEYKFVLKILENENSYTIEYDVKKICTISSLKLYKKYSVDEFISPLKLTVGSNTILSIPPILEIIRLYRDLYNPKEAENWSNILNNIKILENILDKELSNNFALPKKKLNILDENHQDESHQDEKEISKKQIMIKQILLDFIVGSNYLLLEHTIKLKVLTVISKNPIDFDFQIIMRHLGNFYKFGIVYHKKELFLHGEITMERYLFYIIYNDGVKIIKKHILTIYNNLSYELINFIESDKYKVVDPITELRFIYVSIWDLIIAERIRPNKSKFNKNITHLFSLLIHYRKLINIYEYKNNYIGVYTDINITKKINALAKQNVGKYSYYCYEVI